MSQWPEGANDTDTTNAKPVNSFPCGAIATTSSCPRHGTTCPN